MEYKTLFILIGFLFFSSLVSSATKTRDVYEWCTILEGMEKNVHSASPEDWYKAGLCDGFFSGFHDGEYLQYLVNASKNKGLKNREQLSKDLKTNRPWCEPKEGLSLEQRYLMFNKYVKEHPESLHKDSYITLFLAMKPYFPCEK